MNRLLFSFALLASALMAPMASSQEANAPAVDSASKSSEAESAEWKAVRDATRPPLPPSEWNDKKPTNEEYAAFRQKMAEAAAAAADRARDFAVKYPQSPKVAEAKELRIAMLQAAVQLGLAGRTAELKELGGVPESTEPRGADPFTTKMRAAMAKAGAMEDQGMQAVFLEFERQVREVMKEFPDRPEVYAALLQVAEGLGGEKAVSIVEEINSSRAPDPIKKMAAEVLKKAERVGKPLELRFTALDGRTASIADLKGKVVLVDFWATWCGPCVAELPKVKAAYDQLHSQGFEILGISFDQEKVALESFLKKHSMPWPQHFDDSGGPNPFGKEFGIQGIPTMWLVDKQGILRDLNARDDLLGKVEKLLAEK